MEELYEYMYRELKGIDCSFKRYIYDQINWENRMLGLVGPRGVGKTTLFLQRVKDLGDNDCTLYVSADHLYFSTHTLYETADAFRKGGGKFLFVDEVHKYANWSTELKMIYDSMPEIQVFFTGSSVLDIHKGQADLSRRAIIYNMQGLSFREFLQMGHSISLQVMTFDDVLRGETNGLDIETPIKYFKEYCESGYYPFFKTPDMQVKLQQIVNQTLEFDIPQFSNMSILTGLKLKKLMAIISKSAPFKPNMVKLASQIDTSRNSMENNFALMEKAGMIMRLKTGGDSLRNLGKVEKIYLDNTNLIYALSGADKNDGNLRETFFMNQVRVVKECHASKVSDFEVDGITFEVGGKNKGFDQIKTQENAYVVKDNFEYATKRTIPLWSFGLLY